MIDVDMWLSVEMYEISGRCYEVDFTIVLLIVETYLVFYIEMKVCVKWFESSVS